MTNLWIEQYRINHVVRFVLPLYVFLLLYLLYLLRFSIFALLLNPLSIVVFAIGIALLFYLISAIFVGISYLRRPSLAKFIYTALAIFFVVAGLIAISVQPE